MRGKAGRAMVPERGILAVAMSGGVDSTAAALKLREAGNDVIGLTAVLSPGPGSDRALERCADVCRQLRIPHAVIDLREPFERLIVEPFARSYAEGRTPNPCVRCNEDIKFGLLLDEALRHCADALATGHYARTAPTDSGHVYLYRARDLHKDQSYVLHHLSQDQLRRALLPHGAGMRADNEHLVAEAGLNLPPVAESQDVCFLPDGSHHDWLRSRMPDAFVPGEIVDTEGNVLGEHQGLIAYTIGQRKGLQLGGPGGRRFVLHIDTRRNRVIVGPDQELWVQWCEIERVNLIPPGSDEDSRELDCEVMVRYNGTLTPARVSIDGEKAQVQFADAARAPTPGQSAVFYDKDRCLGGGVIQRTELTDRYGG